MDWDNYFMNMAECVSLRSPDPSTKHGCVIVDTNNRVLSTGYNGPVKGFPNNKIDFKRPQKYTWMIHAEDNAVLFAQCNLTNTTAYITGHPCASCFRRLVQAGTKKIVYGNKLSACIDEYEFKVCDEIAKNLSIKMVNMY